MMYTGDKRKEERSFKGRDWFLSIDGKRAVVDAKLGITCYTGGLKGRRFTGQRVGIARCSEDAKKFLSGEPVSLLRDPSVPQTFSEALPEVKQGAL